MVAEQEPVAPPQPQHQQEQTEMGSCVSLDLPYARKVSRHSFSMDRGNVVLTFLEEGARGHNFGFVPSGSGYQPRYRARVEDSIVGYDFKTIPPEIYRHFGRVSKGKSGHSYRVAFNGGGQDVSSYFN